MSKTVSGFRLFLKSVAQGSEDVCSCLSLTFYDFGGNWTINTSITQGHKSDVLLIKTRQVRKVWQKKYGSINVHPNTALNLLFEFINN